MLRSAFLRSGGKVITEPATSDEFRKNKRTRQCQGAQMVEYLKQLEQVSKTIAKHFVIFHHLAWYFSPWHTTFKASMRNRQTAGQCGNWREEDGVLGSALAQALHINVGHSR